MTELDLKHAVEVGVATALDILGTTDEKLSEKAARRKYDAYLDYWERHGLVSPILTPKGGKRYPARVLAALYSAHIHMSSMAQ